MAARALDAPVDGPLAEYARGEIQVRDCSPTDARGWRRRADAGGSLGEQRQRIGGPGMQGCEASKIMDLGLDPVMVKVPGKQSQ